MSRGKALREQIDVLVREYYQAQFSNRPFNPDTDLVHYAGRVFDAEELSKLVDASLDFFLTANRYADAFESDFADYLGVSDALLVNSGSSANLVALTTLTSPKLGDRRLKPGDEVVTVAAGFPTTLGPILQNNLVPVFVDVNLGDYTAIPDQLREAIGPRTRAIMMAHTLGVPVRPRRRQRAREAARPLGDRRQLRRARIALPRQADRDVRPPGDDVVLSGAPHHDGRRRLRGHRATSAWRASRARIRDWGRDCYCAGGESNTCGTRFSQQFGTLPAGYDHKYVYSHVGYNLKVTDMQAAIGCAQLEKLDGFIAARRANFDRLMDALRPYEDRLLLPRADAARGAVVVRIRDHRPRARRLHARRPRQVPRSEPRRNAEPVRRQSAAPSGLPGHSAPRRPRPQRTPTR